VSAGCVVVRPAVDEIRRRADYQRNPDYNQTRPTGRTGGKENNAILKVRSAILTITVVCLCGTGNARETLTYGDGRGFIRREGDGIVAAEMKGPGVIWRVWSAKASGGHIKIYIDGAEKPTLDIPFGEYFNNKQGIFAYRQLVNTLSRGRNSFIPIPYQKSCKVVLAKGWGMYYQITYTTFAKGTTVPSFTGSFSDDEKAALATADKVLAARGADPKPAGKEAKTVEKTIAVAPGKTVEVCGLTGPHAITALKVKPALGADDDPVKVLRELAMSIAWDGEAKPSVWTPLGDFFGTAPGINKYKSLPLGMTDEGFYSYWYMPFGKSASIKITNDGKQSHSIRLAITHAPLSKPADKLLRFHAKWHRDAFPGVDRNTYLSGGTVHPQPMRGFGAGWSGDSHLLWKSGKKGDVLVLTFNVPGKGNYGVKLQLTKAPDYGVFQFHLDGKKLGSPVDLYDPKVVSAGAIDAGKAARDKGVHELKLEITGANEKARPGHVGKYLLDLDYMKLTKSEK